MILRVLILIAAMCGGLQGARADVFLAREPGFQMADRLVLRKAERRLTLYREGQPLRNYRVSLGLLPTGHKEQEGDFRTPEGRYMLTRRNPESEFFLSIQISYPDAADVAAAARSGVSPGGLIMIHGLPNVMRHSRDRYLATDWTDGCIALSNEDMLEVWLLTRPGLPIEITP
ncbi:MAG: L,D-transpeptidase family protein [Steroidobacteraceae bacterium]|jgi:murein L,D-transpeptidase YafK